MAPFLQDMPPEGGYQKIVYTRIPAKTFFSGYTMILGYLAVTFGGIYIFSFTKKRMDRLNVELRSAKTAIHPLLLAERDRAYLKHLRRLRDEEEKLMAGVEGWEVGKYNGKPIFKTLPPDTLVGPTFQEYYAHTSYKDLKSRAHAKFWT